MTDASHATPGPLPPPPARSHGCLWGCLAAALIAIVAIVGAVSYSGYYLYSGFKNNETLKAAMVEVNGDQAARAVLGDNIEITNLSSSNYSTDSNTGTVEAYVAHVKGSKGEGTLTVNSEAPPGGQRHFTKLTLTGPDGHTYDLLSPASNSPGAI